ncbi:nuclease-related domain-containing protein [Pseudoalteromonas rhizosphaerae]|uniref:nuclease-related domain-containing protein n=1 Tax=Pseudoalteromonas rhizosphaerae TaxID=2518973 RepID=UPI003850BFC0
MSDGKYYLFHAVLSGFSISSVVTSVFSQLEIEVKTKGKKFEESIVKRLKKKNVKAKSFKFKRGTDEYEYDAVFILDKRVFVVECKNRSISGWNSIRSARFNKFLSKTSKQVKRLVHGLIEYPEVFNEHFNEDISNFEVIPLIINCLPFSYAGKFEGVYISDSSSFGKFLLSGSVNYHEYGGKDFEESSQSILHHFWDGSYPSSDDLIRHLENPIHLELYRNNIEEVFSYLPSSPETFFVINDLKADMHKGVEIKFGNL